MVALPAARQLGYKDLAKQRRKESIEEMEHADKLIVRIIFLEGFPNLQLRDPLRIGQNVKEVLDCDFCPHALPAGDMAC